MASRMHRMIVVLPVPVPPATMMLALARTAADMDGAQKIDAPHIAEAVNYRALDRKYR